MSDLIKEGRELLASRDRPDYMRGGLTLHDFESQAAKCMTALLDKLEELEKAESAVYLNLLRHEISDANGKIEEQQTQNAVLRETNKLLNEMVSDKLIDKLEKELTNSKLYAERLENTIKGVPDY